MDAPRQTKRINGNTAFRVVVQLTCIVTMQNKNLLLWFVVCCEEVNECATNPCRFGGRCFDHLRHYTCQCSERRTGRNCEYGRPAELCTSYRRT